MTIAVGMICSDGIVLGADRQVTLTDGHKYDIQKILLTEGIGWTSLIAHAGDPDFAKEVQECLGKELSTTQQSQAMMSAPGMGAVTMFDTLEGILTGLGRQFGDVGTDLLVAGHTDGEDAKLWKFNGRSLCRADGFNCLGVGDSSLTRYLSKTLYRPDITIRQGLNLVGYIVWAANEYIDKCSGGPDLAALRNDGIWLSPGQADLEDSLMAMEAATPAALKRIIDAASNP